MNIKLQGLQCIVQIFEELPFWDSLKLTEFLFQFRPLGREISKII